MYNTAPQYITRFRPKLSEIGPMKNVPTAIPTTKDDKTNCARLGSSGVISSAIIESAGNIPSMDNATVATNMAMIATNSAVLIRNSLPIEKYKLNASLDYNNIINN